MLTLAASSSLGFVALVRHSTPTWASLSYQSPRMVATASPVEAFQSWLDDNGLTEAAKVTGKQIDGFGMCLAATEEIRPGTPLLAVPRKLHLTAESAEGTELGKALSAIGIKDESVILAMVLLEQVAYGEASQWEPYISMLPGADDLSLPLLWSEAERAELLRGSHLQACVDQLLDDLTRQWEFIENSIIKPNPTHFPAAVFRIEGFLWATAIVLSRALPFADSLALIPFLDLANHEGGAKNTCSIRVRPNDGEPEPEAWQPNDLTGESAAVLTAGAKHDPSEQVFIDYGEAGWRSSWEMLYTYGFVPGDGPQDWLASGGRPMMFEGVSRDDELHQQKVAMLVALGAEEDAAYGQWVDVKADPEQASSMAPLLRLAHLRRGVGAKAAGEEAEEAKADAKADAGSGEVDMDALVGRLAEWKANPQEVWRAVQSRVSDDNERRVAQQVIEACDAALEGMPSSDEVAEQMASGAAAVAAGDGEAARRGERMRLGALVLAGERHAVEACRQQWQTVLAEMGGEEEK